MNCLVVGKLFEIIKEISDAEKKPEISLNGENIYLAEINFLKRIAGLDMINAAEIANRMNVTRSAVTQMSNKLEKRKLIERFSIPDNKKEKYYKLTSLGVETIKNYNNKHLEANKKMCEYIKKLNDEQVKIVIEFMDYLQQCMPISNFKCFMEKTQINEKEGSVKC